VSSLNSPARQPLRPRRSSGTVLGKLGSCRPNSDFEFTMNGAALGIPCFGVHVEHKADQRTLQRAPRHVNGNRARSLAARSRSRSEPSPLPVRFGSKSKLRFAPGLHCLVSLLSPAGTSSASGGSAPAKPHLLITGQRSGPVRPAGPSAAGFIHYRRGVEPRLFIVPTRCQLVAPRFSRSEVVSPRAGSGPGRENPQQRRRVCPRARSFLQSFQLVLTTPDRASLYSYPTRSRQRSRPAGTEPRLQRLTPARLVDLNKERTSFPLRGPLRSAFFTPRTSKSARLRKDHADSLSSIKRRCECPILLEVGVRLTLNCSFP